MRRVIPAVMAWLLLLSSLATAHSFSPADFTNQLKGEHFTIFYETEGYDAVTPALAAEVLAHAEQAYQRLVVEGGLRPPRVEPVPVALRAGDDSEGGSVIYTAHGFDLSMAINPAMTEQFALGDVVAHELFHVIQAAYLKRENQPTWGIEGTAPLAAFYTYEPGSEELVKALKGHLSEYYWAEGRSMKDDPYLSSLFWYWMAEQYGGIDFLGRVLRWTEDVEWERAAHLAAIEGGAPAETTFDRLWRSFIFALVDGRMPEGFKTEQWFFPRQVSWTGQAAALTRGEKQTGVGPLGHYYTYYEPLTLGSYAYDLVEVIHEQAGAFDLTVEGDARALEAYVIKPGPKLAAALADYTERPTYENFIAPPSDPATIGLHLPVSSPVRLEGKAGERTLVLLMRLGNWGHSSYSVHLAPAGAARPVGSFTPLEKIKQPADSVGSPPPLTKEELAALKASTYLAHLPPLEAEEVELIEIKRVRLKVGDTAIVDGGRPTPLPVAVERDAEGDVWFPVKAVTLALGGRVEGNRYFFGSDWVEVGPTGQLTFSQGWNGPPYAVTKVVKGHLMATDQFFSMAGVGISRFGDTWELTWPDPYRMDAE